MQSFDRVRVGVLEHVFGHGHMSLALTRGRNCRNAEVSVKDTQDQVEVSFYGNKIFTNNVLQKKKITEPVMCNGMSCGGFLH